MWISVNSAPDANASSGRAGHCRQCGCEVCGVEEEKPLRLVHGQSCELLADEFVLLDGLLDGLGFISAVRIYAVARLGRE